MFRSPFTREPKNLDQLINDVELSMQRLPPNDKEYATYLTQLERLNALKNTSSKRFSPDTLLLVGGNLLGILVIVIYENKHVMTSKALGFILKVKT